MMTDSDLALPHRFGFLLLPGFALMSYASTVEPLRAANLLAGRGLYAWRHFSPDGQAVRASTGMAVAVDGGLPRRAEIDTLIVCAGGNRIDFQAPAVLSRLRLLARQGVRLGGVSGGPVVLARAGVLDGYRCTVHWEHAAAFREEFPRLNLTGTLYEIDRGRLTCAGGIAAIDMMHALIGRDHGPGLAAQVNEWFLQNRIREGGSAQRMDPGDRLGLADPRLARVIAAMEARIEEPLPRDALAALAGLSPRQLERLFSAALGMGPGRYYQNLRLERARSLLRQTALTVAEIAVACGFVSPAHFSRAYRALFGVAPRDTRGRG
ncbi:AraC family transcriptional regulator with amidase-like domain [Zavarzinia compransoris]|nr:AraC family transcriptional regulator with amidase-like domain [Zavarzinia compransoris]